MQQAELIAHLDDFFQVAQFDEHEWVNFFEPTQREAILEQLEPHFIQTTCNGLALASTEVIQRVYLLVSLRPPYYNK